MNSENITSKNIEQGLPKVLFCFAFRAHVIVMLNLSLSLAGWELNQMMKTTVMVLGIIGNLSRYVRTFFGETRRRRDMHVTVAVRSIPADITINRCHPKVLVVRPYVYKFAFRFRPTVGWGSTSTLPFSTFILCRKHRVMYAPCSSVNRTSRFAWNSFQQRRYLIRQFGVKDAICIGTSINKLKEFLINQWHCTGYNARQIVVDCCWSLFSILSSTYQNA